MTGNGPGQELVMVERCRHNFRHIIIVPQQVRHVTYQRQNYNKESMENGISNTTELETSGSRVDKVFVRAMLLIRPQ